MNARRVAWLAGAVVVVCVAILFGDYVVASRRGPQDDRTIKALQAQVKSDAALAPRLAAEQKRSTDARRARKKRDSFLAWVLIGVAAVFLSAAKRAIAAPLTNSRGSVTSVVADSGRHAVAPRARPAPPALDLSFVDEIVAREGRGKEAAIILLQAIQSHYRYLPDQALQRLCELTEITPAEVAGTSSFYGQFRRTPVGKHIVRVCHGTACHVGGARQITEELRRHLAIREGSDTDAARMFTVDEVACLGCCSLAPVLTVDGHTSGKMTPATARDALAPVEEKESETA